MKSSSMNHKSKREIMVDMTKVIPYKDLPPIKLNKIDGGVDYLFIDLTHDINTAEQDILAKIHHKIIKESDDITKAINNKEIGKIKNKTGMNKRPGELSFNFSYDVNSPKLLSTPFDQTKDGSVSSWLYAIDLITDKNKEHIFGMCLNANIPFEVSFPLINHSNHNTDQCTIRPLEPFKVSKELFNSIVFFHLKVYYDIFLLKEFKQSEFDEYKKRLFKVDTFDKKYLFIPLSYNHSSSKYHINWQLISRSEELYYKSKGVSLENQLLNKEDISYLKSNYVYATRYRTVNIYELRDILYSNETFDTFIDKISSGINSYKQTIVDKYFKNPNKEITTGEIMTSLNCKSSSVVGYRQLGIKYNIQINPKPIGYAYGMKMNFIPESYLYNKNITKNQCKAPVDLNDEKNKKKIIYPIFPIEHLIQFYLDKKQIEVVMKFPSIFSTYETMLIPFQMAIDFNLNKGVRSNEAFNYFLWAGTTPQVMKDYDYESLEILGDSILKVILTIQLFADDDFNPNKTAGQIERQRAQFIRNNYLYQIGMNTHINQYIISQDYHIKEWDYPLKSSRQIYHQTITEKILADVIEAYIGSCYLKSFDISDCVDFINQCRISPDDIRASVEQYVEEKVIQTSLNWKPMYMIYLFKDLSFLGLLSMFNTNIIEINSIAELELSIKYSFKNKELIHKSLRHYSYDKNDKLNNYEKLELLGDSIVESYITTSIFYWYAPFMYNNNERGYENKIKDINEEIAFLLKTKALKFNNQYMTHIKSYFCSNNFMCQISALLQLYKFVQYGNCSTIKETIGKFSNETNLNLLINRNLNNYESCRAFMPKLIADVFEALIGAIFCDSDLMTTFRVLDGLYGPFVIYAGLYFDELKYSSVDDFTRRFSIVKKLTVDYRVLNNINNSINEEYEIGIFHSGNICYCTGKGKGIESAKQQAAINGLEKLSQEELVEK